MIKICSIRQISRVLIMSLFLCLWVIKLGFCEQSQILKIAVLDSPNMPQKFWLWSRYEHAYLAGIETASLAAKEQGIKIKYKTFFYGTNPLDILEQIPKVKAWHPDIVLGPHYSNQFLLLRKYFPDTLVLSSYASDPDIKNLPDNFYSIFPSDTESGKAMIRFIQKTFPKKNIYMIVQADCKECSDLSKIFLSNYSKVNSNVVIEKVEFIGENFDAIDIEKLTEKYKKDDIILMFQANYFLYENLISRITKQLKQFSPIFITGVDNWGIQGVETSTEEEPTINYEAYRVTPLLFSINNTEKKLLQFNRLFLKRYQRSSVDSVSYMTYLTVMSALTAMEKFPVNQSKLSEKEKILMSFRKALAYDQNWFRSEKYAVYQYTEKGEVLVDTILLSNYLSNHQE